MYFNVVMIVDILKVRMMKILNLFSCRFRYAMPMGTIQNKGRKAKIRMTTKNA